MRRTDTPPVPVGENPVQRLSGQHPPRGFPHQLGSLGVDHERVVLGAVAERHLPTMPSALDGLLLRRPSDTAGGVG